MPHADPVVRRAYQTNRRNANREKWREYHRDYQRRHKDKKNASNRARYAKNPEPHKSAVLKKRYGITLADWNAMLDAQGGRCACCGSPDPRDKTGWHTDHNHLLLKVRGILCGPCNRTVGVSLENTARLLAAVRYLEKHNDTALRTSDQVRDGQRPSGGERVGLHAGV